MSSPRSIGKEHFINNLKNAGFSDHAAVFAFDCIVNTIKQGLIEQRTVNLKGLGKLYPHTLAPRKIVDNLNKKIIHMGEKRTIKFSNAIRDYDKLVEQCEEGRISGK